MRYLKNLTTENIIDLDTYNCVCFCPELNEYMLVITIPWIVAYPRYYWISKEDYELAKTNIDEFKTKHQQAFDSVTRLPLGLNFMGSTNLRDYDGRDRFQTYIKPGTSNNTNVFQHYLYEDKVLYAHILMDGVHYAVLPYVIIIDENGQYVRPLENNENVELISISTNEKPLPLFMGIKVDNFEGFEEWKNEFDS